MEARAGAQGRNLETGTMEEHCLLACSSVLLRYLPYTHEPHLLKYNMLTVDCVLLHQLTISKILHIHTCKPI